MSFFFNQPDPKRRRFPIPNDVWKWELKPQGFSILAFLCYLHVHCNKNASPSADEIASQLHISKDMAVKQIAELNRRGLLDQHMVPILKSNGKNFFSLPNELFFLNIGHGAITVYAYLLYCENRRTHQCHPSCRTIAAAIHLSAATVMKHITKLEDHQLIDVENTNYIDSCGMKWNGNNLYTIRPIQAAVELFYERQFRQLEEDAARQRAAERLAESARESPQNALCTPFGAEASPSADLGLEAQFDPLSETIPRTKEKAG